MAPERAKIGSMDLEVNRRFLTRRSASIVLRKPKSCSKGAFEFDENKDVGSLKVAVDSKVLKIF